MVPILKLSLPFPSAIILTNTVLALLAKISVYLRPGRDIRNKKRWHLVSFVVSFYIFHVLSVVLAVQSSMNGLWQDDRLCHAELQWKRWFQAKDERIRSIQDQLHCCGFNSMVDRAWPFPARGVNADECQRNSGFSTSCGPIWQERLRVVALCAAIASVLNHFLLVRWHQPQIPRTWFRY